MSTGIKRIVVTGATGFIGTNFIRRLADTKQYDVIGILNKKKSIIEANNIKLGIFAVIMTVIGSYYYLRIIKIIYFDKSENNLKSISSSIVTSIYVIALIVLGLFPNILGQLSSHAIANFFNA